MLCTAPMWPFQAKSGAKASTSDERTLESRMRALELDWEDTYERIRRVLQRLSKRAEYIEKKEGREPNSSVDSREEPTPNTGGPWMGRLSDAQREIQQRILRRRAGQ